MLRELTTEEYLSIFFNTEMLKKIAETGYPGPKEFAANLLQRGEACQITMSDSTLPHQRLKSELI